MSFTNSLAPREAYCSSSTSAALPLSVLMGGHWSTMFCNPAATLSDPTPGTQLTVNMDPHGWCADTSVAKCHAEWGVPAPPLRVRKSAKVPAPLIIFLRQGRRELGTLSCDVNWGRKQTQATEKRAQGGPGTQRGGGSSLSGCSSAPRRACTAKRHCVSPSVLPVLRTSTNPVYDLL